MKVSFFMYEHINIWNKGAKLPYSRKYWRSLNLAVWPQTMFFTLYLDFKFGGRVRYRHTYMHAEKNLTDFNLAV